MNLRTKIVPPGSRRLVLAKRLLRRDRPSGSERRALVEAWARHDATDLDEYLVSGYQDPRINAQSILTRHFLVDRLFGEQEFANLKRRELEFCVECNEAVRRRAAELRVTMRAYLDPEKRALVSRVDRQFEDDKVEFEHAWRSELEKRTATPISVLELACGSANDYRFFHSYGISPFLTYVGVDLNQTNIDNSRARFPDVAFRVADIMELPFDGDSVDYVIAFDIFEHLSLSGMRRTIREAARVSRRGVAFSFFNMVSRPEHDEQVRGGYHWNELSAPKLREILGSEFPHVEPRHVSTLLKKHYGADHYYNGKAWTITAERT